MTKILYTTLFVLLFSMSTSKKYTTQERNKRSLNINKSNQTTNKSGRKFKQERKKKHTEFKKSNNKEFTNVISIVIPDTIINIPREWSSDYLGAIVRPDITQKLAAKRLQTLILKATNQFIPIVTASEMSKNGSHIFVGYGKHLEDEISPPTKPEGLKIAEKKGNLYILGEIVEQGTNNWPVAMDRGIMHAIETFAEDIIGYRFMNSTLENDEIFEIGTVIPKLNKLEIKPGLLIEDAPVFNTRLSSGAGASIGLRNGSSSNFSCNHSYNEKAWYKAYAKEHPEMFVPVNTNYQDTHDKAMGAQEITYFLDYTEPLVLKKRIKHLKYFFENGQYRDFFGLGREPTHNYIMEEPPDFNPPNWKYNKRAKELWNPEEPQWGSGSNIWFDYVNRLGKEVQINWPNMRISTLAYYQHQAPPTFDIEDNIDICLALQRSSMACKEPYVFDKNLRIIKEWFEKVDRKRERLYLWEYGCWPTFFLPIPIIPAFSMQNWLQAVRPYISGVFFEYYPTKQFPDYLMRRIWMRLLWNPDLDLKEEIKDFCKYFYGPAGDTMFTFYQTLINRYEMKWDTPQMLWDQYYVDLDLYFEQSFPKTETIKLFSLLNKASREVGIIPEIIEFEARHGATVYLFNENKTASPVKITLSPLEKEISNPSIGYQSGRIKWHGILKPGESLEISTPRKAVLKSLNGESRDVSNQLVGELPKLKSNQADIFYFWHNGAKEELLKLKLNYANVLKVNESSKNIYARRLDLQRIPYTVNSGEPDKLDGFFNHAHMAHKNLNKIPEYKVQKQESVPKTNDDKLWEKIKKSKLVSGKEESRFFNDILGYPAFLQTDFQIIYNNEGLVIRINAEGEPTQDEKIIITLNNNKFTFTLKPQSEQNSNIKHFKTKNNGWEALIILRWADFKVKKLPKTVSCQISRTRNKKSYLWSPPLSMWGEKEQGPGKLIIIH